MQPFALCKNLISIVHFVQRNEAAGTRAEGLGRRRKRTSSEESKSTVDGRMPPESLHDVPNEQQEVHNGEENGRPFVFDA